MSILYEENEINFVILRNKFNITEVNLFSHLNYLEKENLISARNEFRNRKLLTIYSITEKELMN